LNNVGGLGFRKGGNEMTRSMVFNQEEKREGEKRVENGVGRQDYVVDE
jgi:hypothetical protein